MGIIGRAIFVSFGQVHTGCNTYPFLKLLDTLLDQLDLVTLPPYSGEVG